MRGFSTRLACTLCLIIPGTILGQEATPAPSPSVSTTQTTAPFGVITGTVKSGNTPLPGVTVTAANTLTGKKYVTSTDIDGSFKLEVGAKGRYVVRAEFSAFAPATQEILINADNRTGKADLAMTLMSRAQQAEQQQQQQQAQQAAGRMAGLQQLALSGAGGANSGAPSVDTNALTNSGLPNAGLAAEGGNESVAVSGAMGRNDQPTFDPGEMQDRIAEIRDQMARGGGNTGNFTFQSFGGGGFGGGGFGGGGAGGPMIFIMGGPGGPGGGGRGARNFNINRPHGSIFYNYGGSALDAAPFSLSGIPSDKADYSQNRFGITMGGPLNIPHIYKGGTKTFLFGSYIGTRGNNPFDVFSTVPTNAERAGNFSDSSVQLKDPTTGLPLVNNTITNISPVAAQLLQFIPAPNLPGTSRNFHFVSASQSNTDTMFLRFNHSFGADQGMMGMFGPGAARRQQRQQQRQQQGSDQKKTPSKWSQSINGGFSYNNIRTELLNPFPTLGGNLSTNNLNANFGHSAVRGLFINNLRFNYNRAETDIVNHFTNVNNIQGQLGINGASPNPSDFGLPTLVFAPQFSSLSDTPAQFRTNQNFAISDSMSLTHGKHSWSWGGDFRHQLLDVSNASNARGTYNFNGNASGLPFADFLFGFPRQTSIQFGAENYHFHANSYNLFVQDNWRAGKNLTLNLGLRYEYTPPFTEENNRIVNLDVAGGFAAVAPVLPGQTGSLTGIQYPDTLVKPDRNNFAPRVGLAWKPLSKTVVRAGYGINYNLGQYTSLVTQLAFQPPFAVTQTVIAPTPTSLTLQNPFAAAVPGSTTNNYAVDPNYVLAYVQTWNLNVQQEVKGDLIVNIGYTGSKGTHLDIVRAPILDNVALLTGAQAFQFESSNGSSILHAGSLRVRKRMRHGLSVGGTYTYSKSIDNASSIGGGAVVVAQNDLDLAAERGLSSFNQTHRFTADYYYDLPFGKDRKWLNSGSWATKFFGGYYFSGNLTIASGFPFSPRIFGGLGDLARGANGSLRPDLIPGQPLTVGDRGILQWFNTAAFVAPPPGQFGDAGRNIIIGPGTVSLDMSMGKSIQLKEMQRLDVRFSATNVFNHANFSSIDTTLGSPTFGQVTSVGSMRKAQITTRYNF